MLLLSRSAAFEYLSNVLVVEITTSIRGIPQEVGLGHREGLRHRCVANFDNLHSIPRALLQKRVGALSLSRLAEVRRALGYAIGWPELTLSQ